eukprot:CAMPEP_0206272790 /NCGR_PEP_ID=MMETSP0047_2-20121206/34203_1 /ASSEMBLY_ACC=CAM_ASM_000192 /TAXON_ID=195065 /ORGANISM="Chroomonas mesostigmatica_cf, Strain CCMP1168" /LENGTH=102 /DNA_ID=CAMNT_0053701749 /DNA_START=168 /DNA_END=472 /DNA_ORIENTATION=-
MLRPLVRPLGQERRGPGLGLLRVPGVLPVNKLLDLDLLVTPRLDLLLLLLLLLTLLLGVEPVGAVSKQSKLPNLCEHAVPNLVLLLGDDECVVRVEHPAELV